MDIDNDQLGLAFCYNYFMVKDIHFILGWALEIFRKLRPSGHFIFNFIPDDTPAGLELSETRAVTSINHKKLEKELIEMGYEIVNKTLAGGYASTITVKKPGNYDQFKLSGSIVRVIDKSESFL
jgi:hypothetical protein